AVFHEQEERRLQTAGLALTAERVQEAGAGGTPPGRSFCARPNSFPLYSPRSARFLTSRLLLALLLRSLTVFSRRLHSSWTPTAPVPQMDPAPAPGLANANSANALPARKAAAPVAPWTVRSAPRAASAKKLRTSAAAAPEVGFPLSCM
ncbi:hypothetical protein LEMLEM_LOCUS14671, partial [Lemmus lemmus]